MEWLFILAIGLAFGSFSNVLIYRLPRNLSIITPSSFCNFCYQKISWWAKIPILSYCFLGGKCPDCKKSIPLIYCFSELLGGGLAILFVYYFGFLGLLGFFAFLFLYVLGVIDWKYLEIPNSLNFLALFCGVGFGGVFGKPLFLDFLIFDALLSSFVLMGIASFLRLFMESLLQKEVMGEGDVIVFGTLGGMLGILGAFLAIFLGAFLALIVLLVAKKQILPFVPFLVLGAFSMFVLEFFTPLEILKGIF